MQSLVVTEQTVIALLVVAAIVAIAASRLRQPYTLALVIVGVGLSLGPTGEVVLTRDLILLLFLPPLLFESAIQMDLDDLRRRAGQVALLAGPGTVISVAVLWLLARHVLGLPWLEGAVLAVILSPTDPVSVLAIFKEHGVGSGLRTLMEGESIFNDALAIVLYVVAVELVEGHSVTLGQGVFEFGAEIVIGTACGAVIGLITHRLLATTEDHLVEITISIVSAFGPYLLADQLGGSGVIATVVAGLLIGNYGTTMSMSPSSRVAVLEFWEVVVFIVNSLLFLLMAVSFDAGSLGDIRVVTASLVMFGGILLARALIAYGLVAPLPRRGPTGVPTAWRHAIWWGGLRGAIPIALVLGLSERTLGDLDAVNVVFGVVLLSLLGQGLTYKPLLDRLGITGQAEEVIAYEEAFADTLTLRASLDELDRLHDRGDIIAPVWERLRGAVLEDLGTADARLAAMAEDTGLVQARQVQATARRLASAQRAALADAVRRGQLSQTVAAAHTKEIDTALRLGDQTADTADDLGLYPEDDEG